MEKLSFGVRQAKGATKNNDKMPSEQGAEVPGSMSKYRIQKIIPLHVSISPALWLKSVEQVMPRVSRCPPGVRLSKDASVSVTQCQQGQSHHNSVSLLLPSTSAKSLEILCP
jgi:hypothetical protein